MQRLTFLNGPKGLPELIKEDAGTPCFVYFGAKWCPDCDRSSPLVSKAVSKASSACKVFWVDVGDKATFRDKGSEVRRLCSTVWEVRCLPTFVYVGADGAGRVLDRLDTALEECEDPEAGLALATEFMQRCLSAKARVSGRTLAIAGAVATIALVVAVTRMRKR